MPELPNDLFASEIATVAETHLRRFEQGEITRDEVITECLAAIKQRLEVAMNTIEASKIQE